MSPILGVIASSNQQGRTTATGSYDALATVLVPSGGLGTVTFAGIPTGYRNLQILGYSQTNRADYAIANFTMRFNGDTGSNYSRHAIYLFSTLSSDNNTSQTQIVFAGSGAASGTTPNAFGMQVIDILDYASTTKNKTVKCFAGTNSNYTSSYFGIVSTASGAYYSLNPINTITISPFTGEGTLFNAGTRFELYGEK